MQISGISSSAHVSSGLNRSSCGSAGKCGPLGLSEEEREQLIELRKRDREVRSHEQAHVAAGGQHVTGGATYTYQIGPDGVQYAVGGEVGIDVSPVQGDPEATVEKMQAVKRAALAPAQPSAQDQAVAAQAAATMAQAQQEVSQKEREEREDEEQAGERLNGNTMENRRDEISEKSIEAIHASAYYSASHALSIPGRIDISA